MSRTTILQSGAIAFRTKLMRYTDARRFAKCLAANSRFAEVAVVDSLTAKGERDTYVTFQPSSQERRLDMYEDQWNQRLIKGWTEGADYIFVPDADKIGSWWCLSTSGETYEVGLHGCTCPDYEFRCRRAALHCKHMHALDAQRSNGMLDKARLAAAA